MTTPHEYTDQNGYPAEQSRPPNEGYTATGQQVDPGVQQFGAQDPGAQRMDPHTQQLDPDAQHFGRPQAQADPASQHSDHAQRPSADATAGDALFAENHLADLRAQWNDVQAAFVDDPRDCVQKADRLVSSAVEQLTANFSQTRARLEDQWQRGEEASTEDLRVALKRYRDFFDRLLNV